MCGNSGLQGLVVVGHVGWIRTLEGLSDEQLVIWLSAFNKLQANWRDRPPPVSHFEVDKNSQQKPAPIKEENKKIILFD